MKPSRNMKLKIKRHEKVNISVHKPNPKMYIIVVFTKSITLLRRKFRFTTVTPLRLDTERFDFVFER